MFGFLGFSSFGLGGFSPGLITGGFGLSCGLSFCAETASDSPATINIIIKICFNTFISLTPSSKNPTLSGKKESRVAVVYCNHGARDRFKTLDPLFWLESFNRVRKAALQNFTFSVIVIRNRHNCKYFSASSCKIKPI